MYIIEKFRTSACLNGWIAIIVGWFTVLLYKQNLVINTVLGLFITILSVNMWWKLSLKKTLSKIEDFEICTLAVFLPADSNHLIRSIIINTIIVILCLIITRIIYNKFFKKPEEDAN